MTRMWQSKTGHWLKRWGGWLLLLSLPLRRQWWIQDLITHLYAGALSSDSDPSQEGISEL